MSQWGEDGVVPTIVNAQHERLGNRGAASAPTQFESMPTAFPTLIVEQSSDCITFADENGTLSYINPAGRALLGLDPDAVVCGLHITQFIAQPWRDFWLETVRPIAIETGSWQGEMFLLNVRTGKPVCVHRTVTALQDEYGNLLGIAAVSRDISAQKAADGAVRESEERLATQFAELEALYRSAPVGLAVVDTSFRFVRINEQLADMNGLSAADHIGRTIAEILPDLAGQAEQAMRHIFETGEPLFGMEIVGETPAKPGVKRAWRENWVPLFARDGSVAGISVAAIEMTEIKRTADALAEKEAGAPHDHGNRARRHFVCRISIRPHPERQLSNHSDDAASGAPFQRYVQL